MLLRLLVGLAAAAAATPTHANDDFAVAGPATRFPTPYPSRRPTPLYPYYSDGMTSSPISSAAPTPQATFTSCAHFVSAALDANNSRDVGVSPGPVCELRSLSACAMCNSFEPLTRCYANVPMSDGTTKFCGHCACQRRCRTTLDKTLLGNDFSSAALSASWSARAPECANASSKHMQLYLTSIVSLTYAVVPIPVKSPRAYPLDGPFVCDSCVGRACTYVGPCQPPTPYRDAITVGVVTTTPSGTRAVTVPPVRLDVACPPVVLKPAVVTQRAGGQLGWDRFVSAGWFATPPPTCARVLLSLCQGNATERSVNQPEFGALLYAEVRFTSGGTFACEACTNGTASVDASASGYGDLRNLAEMVRVFAYLSLAIVGVALVGKTATMCASGCASTTVRDLAAKDVVGLVERAKTSPVLRHCCVPLAWPKDTKPVLAGESRVELTQEGARTLFLLAWVDAHALMSVLLLLRRDAHARLMVAATLVYAVALLFVTDLSVCSTDPFSNLIFLQNGLNVFAFSKGAVVMHAATAGKWPKAALACFGAAPLVFAGIVLAVMGSAYVALIGTADGVFHAVWVNLAVAQLVFETVAAVYVAALRYRFVWVGGGVVVGTVAQQQQQQPQSPAQDAEQQRDAEKKGGVVVALSP